MDNNQLTNIHIKNLTTSKAEIDKPITLYSDSILINHRKLTNSNVKSHFHDCFELEIVLDGNAINTINGFSYSICKNSFYLLSPVDIHKIDIDGNIEMISIKFTDLPLSKDLINHLNTATYPIVGEFSKTQSETILSSLLKLYFQSESISNRSYFNIYLRSMVEMLLAIVLDQCQNGKDSSVPNNIMLSLLSYVKNHFRENIPLSRLAKQYGYNTNYLRSKFRQLTGKTYVSFVNDERLTYAYRLIELTDMQINEISDSAGYTSLSYFSQIFKAKYGISPLDLRHSLKK